MPLVAVGSGTIMQRDCIWKNLSPGEWRDKLPRGMPLLRWHLSFKVSDDPAVAAAIAYALLTRGCGINAEISYSAGALDVLENG